MTSVNIRKKIMMCLLVTIGLLAMAEIGCRIKTYLQTNDPYHLTIPWILFDKDTAGSNNLDIVDYFFSGSKNCYYKLKPGSYPSPKGYEYEHYTINSLGFRGKEFNPLDKKDRVRIFCVGNSTTFGIESSDNQTWPSRLGYHLNKNKEGIFEVINSGFNGANSLNNLNIIRHELVKYNLDILIVDVGSLYTLSTAIAKRSAITTFWNNPQSINFKPSVTLL